MVEYSFVSVSAGVKALGAMEVFESVHSNFRDISPFSAVSMIVSGVCLFAVAKQMIRERRIEKLANEAVKPRIEIIGAGLSRTGTVSLQQALHTIGIKPTFHTLDMIEQPDRAL